MWLRFTADHDYSPRPGVTIAYKAGMVLNVPWEAADDAVAEGKAVRLKKARKGAVPIEEPVDASEA